MYIVYRYNDTNRVDNHMHCKCTWNLFIADIFLKLNSLHSCSLYLMFKDQITVVFRTNILVSSVCLRADIDTMLSPDCTETNLCAVVLEKLLEILFYNLKNVYGWLNISVCKKQGLVNGVITTATDTNQKSDNNCLIFDNNLECKLNFE